MLSPGPCTVKINYFFQQFFKEARVETAIAVKLYRYLKDIGYVDIDKVSKAVPLGEWETTNGKNRVYIIQVAVIHFLFFFLKKKKL